MKLTKTQEGILNAEMVIGGSISNICGATFFAKPYTFEQLNNTVNVLAEINDAFRIRIDCNSKTQWVEDFSRQDYEVLRFDNRSAFDSYAYDYSHTPIDVNGVLYDVKIFSISDQVGLIYKFHHLICDAWCFSVMRWQLYQVLEENKIPETFSFMNHAQKSLAYLESKKFISDREYFISQFLENREKIQLPDQHFESYVSDTITLEVGAEITEKLSEYANKTNLSTYVLMLTAFGIYYSKTHYNADHFYLGTAVLNRTTNEDRNTIGPFLNNIPFLFNLDYKSSFKCIAEMVDENMMSAFRHQRFNYPLFQESVSGEVPDTRIYDVVFSFQAEMEIISDYFVKWYQNGMQVEPLQVHIDHRNDEKKLLVTYNYLVDKYNSNQIKNMHSHYMNVLSSLVSDDQRLICEDSVLTDSELKTVLSDFNNTEKAYDKELTVYGSFCMQAEKTPDRQAVIFKDNSFTYSSLLEKVDVMAECLHCLNIGESDVVAVNLDRSPYLIVLQLAILKIGGVFLPVDKRFPKERLRFLCNDCNVSLLISDGDAPRIRDIKSLGLDELLSYKSSNLYVPDCYSDNCYIIYTSGSTGTPKGCYLKQSGLLNFCLNNNTLTLLKKKQDNVFACVNSVAFDYFIAESLLPLLNGYTIAMCDEDESLSQDSFLGLIDEYHINVLMTTPTRLLLYFDDSSDCQALKKLDCICTSGEPLTDNLLNRIYRLSPNAKVFNPLGPSECTVWDLGGELDRDCGIDIHLGKPVANTQIYVLDKYMQPVPVGVIGELCIAGDCVGGGYLNRPELTSEKFIDNPYGNGKLYKSGDLVRWREDGNVDFVGRNDFQVKVNGQRVELGEIESSLSTLDGIENVAVLERKDNSGRQFICAFYTGREYVQYNLRNALLKFLPVYMVPHIFVYMNDMPLTTTGKIDRKALELLPVDTLTELYEDPVTDEEKILALCISNALNIDAVGRNDQFFAVGGDSIRAIQVVSSLLREGYELSISDLMRGGSISDIAKLLKPLSGKRFEVNLTTDDVLPFSPVAYAYLHMNSGNLDTYSQSCILCIDADKEKIENAIIELAKKHNMLRAVFENNSYRILSVNDFINRFNIFNLNLTNKYCDEDTAKKILLSYKTKFNLNYGPLIDAAICETSLGVFLKLTIHHFIVDLYSWEIIIPDLKAIIYGDCSSSSKLVECETTFSDWLGILSQYNADMLPDEVAYWKTKKNELSKAIRLFCDSDSLSEEETIHLTFSSEICNKLLSIENNYGIRMDVLLFASLANAGISITGGPIAICMENIGRTLPGISVNIDYSIGWYTSVYPFLVEFDILDSNALINLQNKLSNVPNCGIGWLMRYRELPQNANLMFNFYRYHSENENRNEIFVESNESLFPNMISVDCLLSDNDLKVRLGAQSFNRSSDLLNKLADSFYDAVARISQISMHDIKQYYVDNRFSDPQLTNDQQIELESIFSGMDNNESN